MVDPDKLKYKNITISGLPGAGSSTLGRGLAKVLGWEYFSGGDFMRAYAVENGLFDAKSAVHHKATVYGDEFDKQVDFGMRDWLKKKQAKILESWLSGFVAQGIKGTLKVLIFCSEDRIRVDRLVNRDGVSVEEAKEHIFTREEENLKKWTRLYKKQWQEWVKKEYQGARRGEWLDFYQPKLYDLAIDTLSHDRKAVLNTVLEKLGYKGI